MLQHAIAYRTDVGHAHAVNQDAGGARTFTRVDGVPASLALVADGVSAGEASEEASRLVADILCARVTPLLASSEYSIDELRRVLTESALEAAGAVAARPQHSASSADATTLVAVVVVGTDGTGVWCGDSRVYLVGDEVRLLTHDHSWAEGAVASGLMSAEEAARDPRSHMITHWLGPPDGRDPGIERFDFRLLPGQTVLACSDGLYRYVETPYGDRAEIREALEGSAALQAGLDRLVTTALRRGGQDNITGAAIRCGQDDADR